MPDDLRDDPLLAGVPEVDGYKVLDPAVLYARIGAGGMGSVYRGRHVNLEIDVAVKVLDPDLARKDKEFVARFRREANLAARITHANLVRVFDIKEGHGLHYIVMEYVGGETALERVARKGPLGAAEALDIALEAAKGLGAAHARGVVHRDVKPENLLIDREGNVKVADLGLAHAAEGGGLTQTKVRMGTPRYMPPEQWEDARSVGPPGDVWALAATMYFLLAGDHAIREGSLPEILKRVCLEPFPDIRKRRREVPDALVEILERCTAKRPEDRYADAGQLEEALQAFRRRLDTPRLLPDAEAGSGTVRLAAVSPPPMRTIAKIKEGTSPGTPSPPPATRVPTPEPPRRSRVVPIVVAVLLIAAAGGAYLLFKGKEGAPGAGGDSRETPEARSPAATEPSAEDYEQALSLQADVRTRRERLDRAPKDFADRAARAADEAERAILGRLEAAARDLLRSDAVVEVDASLRAGDAMVADRQYGKARAKFEGARRGLDALSRKLEACEGQYRAEAAIAAAEALRQEVAAWYAANTLRAPKELGVAAEELRGAREKVKSEAFAEALAMAREAERLLRDARTAGGGLLDQRAAAQQAESAAREAVAAWEKIAPIDDPRTANAKETLDSATNAFDDARFDEAKAGYDAAGEAFDALVQAARDANLAAEAWDAASKAREAWQVLAKAEKIDPPAEVGPAEAAMAKAEADLGKRAFADAAEGFSNAEQGYRTALEKGNAVFAAMQSALSAWEAATSARAAWEALAKKDKLDTPPEARAAKAAMAKAEEQLGKKAFGDAARGFAEAEQRYRSAYLRYAIEMPAGWKAVDRSAGAGGWAKRAEDPRTGIIFILVEPGTFEMGSPEGEGEDNEHPRHEVRITKPFYLAETETTVVQWRKFAESTKYKTEAERGDGGCTTIAKNSGWRTDANAVWSNPLPSEAFVLGDRHPVTQVSWNDAKAFCDHWGYRLPTEAEWEYACRAGTKGKYWWGDAEADGKGKLNLCDAAAKRKFSNWSWATTWDDGHVFMAPVGSFEANPWGFMDILGNAWEWCADGYDGRFYQWQVRDDPIQIEGDLRVRRGGSWHDALSRAADRTGLDPSGPYVDLGFRVAKAP